MRIAILMIFVLTTRLLIAETPEEKVITGFVQDTETNVSLPDAIIRIVETNSLIRSDENGKFNFIASGFDSVTIECTYIGYNSFRKAVAVGDVALIPVLLSPAPISLEDVIVTAKYTPSAVAIAQLDQLVRPIQNAQELLQVIPGLFIAQHAGGGKAEQIFFRGFDIDHGTDLSIRVDNMPVNMVSHAHGQGYADLHFVILETIDKMAITKGPYDITAGDFATSGSVQLQTIDKVSSPTLQLSYGQFDTKRILLLSPFINKQAGVKQTNAYFAGEYYGTDGPFISPQDLQRINLFAKWSKRSIHYQTDFSAGYFNSNWNASGQIPMRAVESGDIDRFGAIDDTEGGKTSRAYVQGNFTRYMNDITWYNNYYGSIYAFDLFSNFTFFLEDSINGDMIHQFEQRNLLGMKSILVLDKQILGKHVETKFGFGARMDDINGVGLDHVDTNRIAIDVLAFGNVDQYDTYSFMEQSLQLNAKVQLSYSLRYDQFFFYYLDKATETPIDNAATEGILTGHINAVFDLGKDYGLQLSAGKGFHSNDARVSATNAMENILPAAYGSDATFFWDPAKNVIIQSTSWLLYSEQEFVYVGDAAIVEPSGRSFRCGQELSMRYAPMKWLFLDCNVQATRARSIDAPENEDLIPLAPLLTSTGGLQIKTEQGITAGLRYKYIADRPADEAGEVMAQGYLVHDAVLQYTYNKLSTTIDVRNLFNVEWNEAQFNTTSRLQYEPVPVTELHFTPGVPFSGALKVQYVF